VQQVAAWTHARIARVLAAHGRSLDGLGDEPAELTHDQPVLASCYAASAADVQLLGDTAGQRTLKLVQAVGAVRPVDRALAEVGGVNIHAEVAFDGRDRKRLEHVLRYMARPPLALDRLEQRSDGHIVYRFKRPRRDGTQRCMEHPGARLEHDRMGDRMGYTPEHPGGRLEHDRMGDRMGYTPIGWAIR